MIKTMSENLKDGATADVHRVNELSLTLRTMSLHESVAVRRPLRFLTAALGDAAGDGSRPPSCSSSPAELSERRSSASQKVGDVSETAVKKVLFVNLFTF